MGLLLFVMAVFLGSTETGSWNESLFNFTPLPWMYKFYYLKYLFIVLPGTLAGEWLIDHKNTNDDGVNSQRLLLIGLLCFVLIGMNVALLFSRILVLNLGVTAVLLIAIYYLVRAIAPANKLLKNCFCAGAYLLLLGLFFEAYEGGIHKDPSTYSHYFVTAGLSFFMLIGFYGLQLSKAGSRVVHFLALNGRNAMVAYVAGSLLLLPLLHLTGAIKLLDSMRGSVWSGFLRGVLFTGMVSLVTVFFTKRKWFWRT
ncbi:DUF5009 domain-containing protein [Segetibacter sp. 3557_3]|uniref:DUF5009 domain-containing protein n=1 Tax=Segetibacter sp. 3557_3 TaxID=2547429 RepID=UPI001A9DE4EF|nr:DUF5009 domain-containing protein [Segetibacter sp. 3557_3]